MLRFPCPPLVKQIWAPLDQKLLKPSDFANQYTMADKPETDITGSQEIAHIHTTTSPYSDFHPYVNYVFQFTII